MKKFILAAILALASISLPVIAANSPVIWGPGNKATVIPPILVVGGINYTGGGSSGPQTTTWTTPTSVTGTLTNSALGTAVTGTGTKFRTAFHVGDTVTMNAETQTIAAIASDTAMTTSAWTGANTGATATRAAVDDFFVYPNGNFQSGGSRAGITNLGQATEYLVSSPAAIGSTTVPTTALFAVGYVGNASVSAGAPQLDLIKARGTEAAMSAVTTGDFLGSLIWRGGTSSSTFGIGARIDALTTENWGTTALGSQLRFQTVPNTLTTATTALTLDQDQSATFGGQMINTHITTGTNADTVCMKADGTFLIQAAACTISSRRFKENIEDLTNKDGLDIIMALKPVEFNMIEDKKHPNPDQANFARTQVGLIAEDVEKVDRRLAIYEPDGVTPKSYRQEALISVLVKGMQEQQAEITRLKRAIKKLRY